MSDMMQFGTGAVRSTEIAHERWDLISWDAVGEISDMIRVIVFESGTRPNSFAEVSESIAHLGLYLRHRHDEHLAFAGARLALGIEAHDAEEEYAKWLSRILEADSDAFGGEFVAAPPNALARLAATCNEGAIKYGENNWLKGIPVSNLCSHALRHMVLFLSGDESEDNLGHAMWNIHAAIYMAAHRPDMRLKNDPERQAQPEVASEGHA